MDTITPPPKKLGTDFRRLLPCSIKELQRRLHRKSYTSLFLYVSGWKPCPEKVCLAIERVLDGAITCEQMNPAAFQRPAHRSVPPPGAA